MAFGNDWNSELKMALKNEEGAEKMLHLYLYSYMKKKNLYETAELFAQETNIDISQVEICDENLLTEWWESFWPTFCSRLSKKTEANAESSKQENHAYRLVPPLESSQLSFHGLSGLSAAQALGNWSLGFPPVQLFPTQITPMPPPFNPSQLQIPVTMQSPPQFTWAPRNDVSVIRPVQVELTYPAGWGSTYPPPAPYAVETNWGNQLPPTGGIMAVPGSDLDSHESRVPDQFLQFIRQAAEIYTAGSNPPANAAVKETK